MTGIAKKEKKYIDPIIAFLFSHFRIPAFDLNGYYAITFIVFMILNLFIFNNIVLAAIYANFKKNLKEEVKISIKMRRRKLHEAFTLLKKRYSTNDIDEFAIDFITFERLIQKIYPNKSQNKTKILFNLLDFDEGNSLCEGFFAFFSNNLIESAQVLFQAFKEFLYFAELLNYKITEVNTESTFMKKRLPRLFSSMPSLLIEKVVKNRWLRAFLIKVFLIFM